MAPASSTRTRQPLAARQQVSTPVASTKPLVLGKVSKAAAVTGTSAGKGGKCSESKKSAVQKVVVLQEKKRDDDLRARAGARQRSSTKRKRNQSRLDDDDEEEDSESNGRSIAFEQRFAPIKKTKIQLLTPPHSQHNTDTEGSSPIKKTKTSFRGSTTLADLPESLQQLASLHSAFLKAFSLHEAHNGPSVPVEIGDLMLSTTRLWKKATVTQLDLQRMLAIHEVNNASIVPSVMLDPVNSPFVLVTSGLGFNVRTNVETSCVGHINPSGLQLQYEQKLVEVFDTLKSKSTSFVHCLQSSFPLLAIRIGTQTQTHRQKMSSVRAEILSKPQKPASSELDFSKLSISDQMMDMTPTKVKSRTLSLFDRVRAKGVAGSAAAAPTPAQLTRRHAMGRIPEVVDFLRMKQSQKAANSSSILSWEDLQDDASSASGRNQKIASSRRVSFSLTQVVREVRESVTVPISTEEVSMIITILATEIPELGGWVRVFTKGCVVSVTLDGNGLAMSGKEVGLLAEQKERNR